MQPPVGWTPLSAAMSPSTMGIFRMRYQRRVSIFLLVLPLQLLDSFLLTVTNRVLHEQTPLTYSFSKGRSKCVDFAAQAGPFTASHQRKTLKRVQKPKFSPKSLKKRSSGRVKVNADQQRSSKKISGSTPKEEEPTVAHQPPIEKKKASPRKPPPWSIVRKQDMAKHAEAEKRRRKLAKEGLQTDEYENADVRISTTLLPSMDQALLSWKPFTYSPGEDNVEFLGCFLEKRLPPRLGVPEVAFLGRSNVGKSSLLNKLISSTSARVGKTPGATASVNMYGIYRNSKAILGFADLPGFGYAKLSKERKEMVENAAEHYLSKRKELMLAVLLVDIRREPSPDDRSILAALFDMRLPIIVVATKVDKLSDAQRDKALKVIRDGLGLPDPQPFFVSSVTGVGIKDLWKIIIEACDTGVLKLKSDLGACDEEEEEELEETVSYRHDGDELEYNQGYDWAQQVNSEG